MKLKKNIKSVTLCSCRKGKGCPVVTFDADKDEVTIVDDYGSSVRMKISEFLEISKRQNEYLEKDEIQSKCNSLDCGCEF